MIWLLHDHFGGHCGGNLGLILAYESDFETLGSYFGVTLGSSVGLMGPKSGNLEKVLGLKRCFGCSKAGRLRMTLSGGRVLGSF